LSPGTVDYGPVYFFRNSIWRLRKDLVVNNVRLGAMALGTNGLKYSNSADPASLVWMVHNTFWTDIGASSSGGAAGAGGSGGGEHIYLRNNIVRVTRYGFDAPTGSRWDEDYDYFYTADLKRGINYGQVNKTTVASYRSASGQGAHTNVADIGGAFHSDSALTN